MLYRVLDSTDLHLSGVSACLLRAAFSTLCASFNIDSTKKAVILSQVGHFYFGGNTCATRPTRTAHSGQTQQVFSDPPIGQPGDVPMGIAGIYATWRHPDGRELSTFAILTVNADEHALMRRFHRPGEEKRMVVLLHPDDYAQWLSCSVVEAPKFFRLWDGPLDATPEPLPPRAPRASSVDTTRSSPPQTPSDDSAGDLFA